MANNLIQTHTIIVKILGADDGYWNPGKRTTCKARICYINGLISQLNVTTALVEGEEDRVITVHNFRNNIPLVHGYYLVFKIGNVYALDSQASFTEWTS